MGHSLWLVLHNEKYAHQSIAKCCFNCLMSCCVSTWPGNASSDFWAAV